jgi:heptosyltransferase-2
MQCQKPYKTGVILHPGAIGDCLLTLPLVEAVKRCYALDRFDFIGVSDYIDFYPGRTCINSVRSMEGLDLHRLFDDPRTFEQADNDRLMTVFARYEQIISFMGIDHPAFEQNLLFAVHSTHSAEVTLIPAKPDPQSPRHVADYYLDVFQQDHQIEDELIRVLTTVRPLAEDYLAGRDLLERLPVDPEKPVVVIAPGSGSREKCWHWENFMQLAADLTSRGIQPVFLLGPAEQERFEASTLQTMRSWPVLENVSLTQVLQVLTQADAFLGNDSGIGHLAAAMGKNTLILFGPTNPAQYAPRGEKVVIEHLPPPQFEQFSSQASGRITESLLRML